MSTTTQKVKKKQAIKEKNTDLLLCLAICVDAKWQILLSKSFNNFNTCLYRVIKCKLFLKYHCQKDIVSDLKVNQPRGETMPGHLESDNFKLFLFSFSLLFYFFKMIKFRLDPFPQFTELVYRSLLNARFLIFSTVVAKITLDKLYKYAVVCLEYDMIFAYVITSVTDNQSFRL